MADDRIELFVGLIETIDAPGAVDACRRLLSVDERIRADRFMFERHRRQYIFAHAMLRLALSHVAPDVAPTDWSFGGALRQLRLSLARGLTPLHFSLSHAERSSPASCLGIRPSGVDVEPCHVGSRHCRPRFASSRRKRSRRCGGLPEPVATERFFDYWTLKEAYLKARGFGLNLPLTLSRCRCPGKPSRSASSPISPTIRKHGASRCARRRPRIVSRSPTAPAPRRPSHHPQWLAAPGSG